VVVVVVVVVVDGDGDGDDYPLASGAAQFRSACLRLAGR
jgi:hypothetical protein